MDSDLTAPLLTSTNKNEVMCRTTKSSADSEWPTDVAERTKLYVPPEYGLGDGIGEECILRFDAENKALLVVSDGNDESVGGRDAGDGGTILDMFYAYDIVGADVEIKLLDSAGAELRSTSGRPLAFHNRSQDGDDGVVAHPPDDDDQPLPGTPVENEGETGGCSIFKPLTEDIEKIFSTSNNEPLTAIPFDTQATALLTIYVYPRKDPSQTSFFHNCFSPDKPKRNLQLSNASSNTSTSGSSSTGLGHRYAHHRRFQVAPAEDFSNLSNLVRAIRSVSRPPSASSVATAEQRILAVINPVSGGNRNGEGIFDTVVVPMLEQAGIAYDKFVTKYSKHAAERMRTIETTRKGAKDTSINAKQLEDAGPAGILTDSSGDDDNEDTEEKDISNYTAIVTVGGDGIIHEVLQGIRSRPDAKQLLKQLKLGVIGTGTANGFAMSLAHASKELCSPLDSAFFIAKGKSSPIDLSRFETRSQSYYSFLTHSWSIVADIDIESEALRFLGSTRFDLWGVLRVLFLRRYRARFSYLEVETSEEVEAVDHLPPLSDPVPSGWKTIEDDFILFWASHVTHAGQNTFHAPQVKLGDGYFTIQIVRGNVSRLRTALVLLGLENGSHADMDCVEFIKCSAYRLEPISDGSFNDLDGEVIESGPIQGYVMPSAVEAFCNVEDGRALHLNSY